MIITCINCDKKFNVNSELIPNEGRTIQCGLCNFTWYFKKDNREDLKLKEVDIKKEEIFLNKKDEDNKKTKKIQKKKEKFKYSKADNIPSNKGSEIVKYKSQSNFTLFSFLSYIIIFIISFIALIILLDTFKFSLYVFFPNLETIMFSFFETLKDIKLFIKDLIKI